jgi:hypothetical protein
VARIAFDALLHRDEASSGIYVRIPLDVRAAFGRARPAVRVTINDHSWRSTISVYGGVSMLGINRANREAAGISAGEVVSVVLESDDAPRRVEVPEDLAATLAAAPDARALFDAMSFTHRLEYVRWIEEAKRPETRARRLASVVDRIREGRAAG